VKVLSYVHLRNIYRSTGVGRVARELTEHLARSRDIDLEVLADPEDHRKVIDKVGEPWTSYRYHFFKHDTSRQQALWYLMDGPCAESYWPETELVYCTAESYVPVRKAKLVISCHDAQHFEPGVHKMSFWLMKQRFKWKLLFDRLAREADMFHMISEYSAERTAHFFPAIKSRLRVIPNAASDSFFRPPTERGARILDELGLRDRAFVLVPGGLHHRKNADLILDAWPHVHERHPDLAMVIINHSNPVYLARAQAMGPSVVIAGFQEEEQLVALYKAAQLVWFPTRYDGFGMPVIEAMASGTPVISSNTSGIPEVAGDAAMLLSPDCLSDHVEAISGLVSSERERERLSRLGCLRAQRYTWASAAQQLADGFSALF
jgi:glycosyltransferase involved in cell wall biosynthesis